MHLSLPKTFDPGIRKKEGHPNRDQKLQERQLSNTRCPKKKIIFQLVEAIKVSLELSHSVYQCPNTDIIHLVFVENVEIISGCKEESFKEITPDNLLLLKESTPNIVRTKATRNVEYHQPQKRYNAHVQSRGVILSYLLKGKPPDTPPTPKPKQYQEGGDVVVTKSMVQPESHLTFQTGHLGGTRDRGSVQGGYLDKKEYF
ncbi:hypothetical protein F2Q69_00028932 [Brassica cretica]|uniref:Uncharacterized protein n=1 Tax=Brassica cretica TaxID=69181 RepID=A0A8S9RRQ0_BRACR|nr:hypothetical protein F2Q69_00028932 [Brassica cretica]